MDTVTVMPRDSRDWTFDELAALLDGGLQYGLLDGVLLVTPAPIPDHQRFARGVESGSATGDQVLPVSVPYQVTVRPADLPR